MDGGIRRGTDVIKALALGAKAVGIGRPVLYSLATYGQAGIEKMVSILREEMHVGMRLIGCTDVSRLEKSMAVTPSLAQHSGPGVADRLSDSVYVQLPIAKL